jgi:limonene-1,2-epoxide hydrolase
MDAQGTMRLMFDTMDAYDRADPVGPHCRNRDDIFAMFRRRMDSDVRIAFDDMRSTPTHVVLTARVDGFDPVVSVFGFEGRRIVAIRDYTSMEAAQSALAPERRSPARRWWRRWWRPGSRG